MSNNIDVIGRDEFARRKARQEQIVARRRAAKRKQQIKRLIVFGIAFVVVLVGLIFLIVKGVKAIATHFGDSNDNVVVSEQLSDGTGQNGMETDGTGGGAGAGIGSGQGTGQGSTLGIDDGTGQGIGNNAGNGTGQDIGAGNSSTNNLPENGMWKETTPGVINEEKVFEGYSPTKTDSTYYYTSENMQSEFAILIDAQTGNVVCQKDGFTRIVPASMTKMLTVLVAAEHISRDELKNKVTITLEDTDYAYTHDLAAVGFLDGDVVTVEDLFYGTILKSGADTAHALARYVAGDEESFVEMMNDKLKELGLDETTHFTNCVGFYNEDHYSTCADMAMILKATMENPYCYEVMKAHRYTTSKTAEQPDGIEISNWFLRKIEDKDSKGLVVGAKTGYVHQSGNCGASYAVQNSKNGYFCVTANAHSSWRCIYDHVDIYYNCAK